MKYQCVGAVTDRQVTPLWQTFSICVTIINRHEQTSTDIIVGAVTSGLASTDASGRDKALLEGEQAVTVILPELTTRLAILNETRHVAGMP